MERDATPTFTSLFDRARRLCQSDRTAYDALLGSGVDDVMIEGARVQLRGCVADTWNSRFTISEVGYGASPGHLILIGWIESEYSSEDESGLTSVSTIKDFSAESAALVQRCFPITFSEPPDSSRITRAVLRNMSGSPGQFVSILGKSIHLGGYGWPPTLDKTLDLIHPLTAIRTDEDTGVTTVSEAEFQDSKKAKGIPLSHRYPKFTFGFWENACESKQQWLRSIGRLSLSKEYSLLVANECYAAATQICDNNPSAGMVLLPSRMQSIHMTTRRNWGGAQSGPASPFFTGGRRGNDGMANELGEVTVYWRASVRPESRSLTGLKDWLFVRFVVPDCPPDPDRSGKAFISIKGMNVAPWNHYAPTETQIGLINNGTISNPSRVADLLSERAILDSLPLC